MGKPRADVIFAPNCPWRLLSRTCGVQAVDSKYKHKRLSLSRCNLCTAYGASSRALVVSRSGVRGGWCKLFHHKLHTAHCTLWYFYCILHPAHCVLDRHTSITHFSVEDYGSILYWDFVILCSPNPQSLRRQELAIIEIMLLCYLVSICCNILATCHTC